MKLLLDITRVGAPDDYLYARIRCRRALLDLSGRQAWRDGGDPRELLKREYGWVYRQMNARLRRQLLPIFEIAELRTLVLCLRNLIAENRAAINDLLQHSLLHPLLRRELLNAERATPLVARLEQLLADDRPLFRGVAEIYLRQGPGGLEQRLLGGHLQQALERSRLPVVKDVLRYLLDTRNLLAIYKHLRWQIPLAPPLLAGGSLTPAQCERLWQTQDMPRLLTFLQNYTGLPEDPEQAGVEDFLFQGLSLKLKRAGRDPLQPGLVVDYLWRSQQAARQRGLHLERDPDLGERVEQEVG